MLTCKMYLQLQTREDLIRQMVLLCIVASYEYHINEVTFGTGWLQLECFQCKSVMIWNINDLFKNTIFD